MIELIALNGDIAVIHVTRRVNDYVSVSPELVSVVKMEIVYEPVSVKMLVYTYICCD